MPDMLVLVPTRGRPDNVARLHKAFKETATGDTEIMFVADDDDPELARYRELVGTHLAIGPRRRLGGTLNHWGTKFADVSDIIGFVGDDVVPRTRGWDEQIFNVCPKYGVVYANDGVHGPGLPTAVFLDAELIQRLGYMVLPGMTHLFIDNYWKALGESLGTLTYLPHVLLEHLHPLVGKAEDDLTYQQANSAEVWSADEERLREHVESGELAREVSRVLA